jgi:hypothetical protein
VYALLKGTIESNMFSIKILDPVVILLCIFIIITLFVLLINLYKQRIIIIGSDYIIFKSRFREKKYYLNDILGISISREKVGKIQDALRIIRIMLTSRKSPIIIRNSSFKDEEKLLYEVLRLRRQIKLIKPNEYIKKKKSKIQN